MGEKFIYRKEQNPSSEAFFGKKEKRIDTVEKGIAMAEAIKLDCMQVLERLDQEIGQNDYMVENDDKFASYRSLRNYTMSLADKADRFQGSLERLKHDARTQEENPEGSIQA